MPSIKYHCTSRGVCRSAMAVPFKPPSFGLGKARKITVNKHEKNSFDWSRFVVQSERWWIFHRFCFSSKMVWLRWANMSPKSAADWFDSIDQILQWKKEAQQFVFILWLLTWLNTQTYQTSPWFVSRKMKYILVTGGVISGIGKGIISSSVGTILRSYGFRVTSIKVNTPFDQGWRSSIPDLDRSLHQYRCGYFLTLRTRRSVRLGRRRVTILYEGADTLDRTRSRL